YLALACFLRVPCKWDPKIFVLLKAPPPRKGTLSRRDEKVWSATNTSPSKDPTYWGLWHPPEGVALQRGPYRRQRNIPATRRRTSGTEIFPDAATGGLTLVRSLRMRFVANQ